MDTAPILPEGYRQALQGLQQQAIIATQPLPERGINKDTMRVAQKRMFAHDKECNAIYRLLMGIEITIPELTESKLLTLLIEHDPYFSHYRDKPVYYTALRYFAGKYFYFITQYCADIERFGGSSTDLQEALAIGKEAIKPEKFLLLDYESSDVEEFCKTLKRPDLASYFSVIKQI